MMHWASYPSTSKNNQLNLQIQFLPFSRKTIPPSSTIPNAFQNKINLISTDANEALFLGYSFRFITFAKKIEMEELSKEEIERKNKVKTILHDIKVGKEKKVIAGLNALKIHGDDEVILPLVQLWSKGVSSTVEQAIIDFISDIKSSSSASVIMDILQSEDFSSIHLPLLTTIWNSKVDYSEYLTDFVNIAVNQSNMMYSIEGLTIIENLDGPFEEHQILDAQIILRDYADQQKKNSSDDENKIQLIAEIAQLISSFEQNLTA